MTPYQYVHNNPIMFTDPTGMSAEGPGDECGGPPESRKSSASTQAVKNLAKKYFSTAMSVLSDPVGSAQSAFQSVAQEGADFINKDGGNVANTIFRKGSEAYNSIVNRIKNSSDPAFEFQVIVNEYSYEAIANILVGEGLGALVGRGVGVTIPKGTPSLRLAYEAEVRGLSNLANEMRTAGKSSKDIAITLHGMRRELGVKYKSLTPADKLKEIYQRNIIKYGDKLGPSIDYLRTVKGKSWDEIIESSSRPGGKDLKF